MLGGDENEVLAAIEAARADPGQRQRAPARSSPPARWSSSPRSPADPPAGARLRPLSVAGAFHTPHMAPAVDALRGGGRRRDRRATRRSRCCPTATAPPSHSGADWLERIITQVSAPVRWDLCMRTMADLGATAFIELPPGGTLTGLARRALPGVATVALKTPDDLDRGPLAARRARRA